MSADRLSGGFFLLLGLGLYFLIIPLSVEVEEGGNIAPDTLPNVVAMLMAVCGALLVLRPTTHQVQDKSSMWRAALYALILAAAVYVMSVFGFVPVAPVLALIIMLMIGERRPLLLLTGTVVMPALIWFFVTIVLDRSFG